MPAAVDAYNVTAVLDEVTCTLAAADVVTGFQQRLSQSLFVGFGSFAVSRVAVYSVSGSQLELTLRCFLTAMGGGSATVFRRPVRISNLVVMPLLDSAALRAAFGFISYRDVLPPLQLRLVNADTNATVAGLGPADSSCTIDAGIMDTAASNVASSSLIAWRVQTKQQQAPFSDSGNVTFSDLRLEPLAEHAGMLAALRIRCSVQQVPLRELLVPVVYDAVALVWREPPPTSAAPSAAFPITPVGPRGLLLRLQRSESLSPLQGEHAHASCTVVVTRTVNAISAGAADALVVGESAVASLDGNVTLGSFGLDAPFGAVVTLTICCVRDAGQGEEPPQVGLSVVIPTVRATWTQPPPSLVYAYEPFSFSVAVADGTVHGSTGADGGNNGVLASAGGGRIPCTPAAVTADSTSAAPFLLSGTTSGLTQFLPPSGQLSFNVSLEPLAGRSGSLIVRCSIGSHMVQTNAVSVTLPSLGIAYAQPPPDRWLIATPTVQQAIQPSPLLLVVDSAGRVLPALPASACLVRLTRIDQADAYEGATALVNQPAVGFAVPRTLHLFSPYNTSRWLWSNASSPWITGFVAAGAWQSSAFSVVAADGTSNATDQAVLPALALEPFMPTAADTAARVQMCVQCTRLQRDQSNSLCTEHEFVPIVAAVLGEGLPRALAPSVIFNLTIALVDAGRVSLAQLPTADPAWVTSAPFVVADDFDTVCSLGLDGLPAGDTKTTVLARAATAKAGVASWPSVSIAALSGTTATVRVTCSRGGILLTVYPQSLWPVAVEPCPAATKPASNGFGCDQCGDNTYSDTNATYCIPCPPRLATCVQGVLVLHPGFYLAPATVTYTDAASRRVFISSALEVHDCYAPQACTFSASERTFGCAEGYGGPYCAVCSLGWAKSGKTCNRCPPTVLSWLVVSLLPLLLLGLGVWAAMRRITASSPQAPLIRIVLSYAQILGTLLGGFITRGTATFRAVFGFAEAAGSGPLTLSPVSCALGLNFYARFFVTLALPVIMVGATVMGQLVVRLLRRWQRRRSASQLAPGGRGVLSSVQCKTAEGRPTAAVASVRASVVASSFRWRDEGATNSDACQLVQNPLQQQHSPRTPARPSNAAPDSAVAPLVFVAHENPKCPRRPSTTRICSKAWWRRILSDPTYVGPVVFVVNLVFPSVVTSAFNAFDCHPDPVTVALGVREMYLTQDFSLVCGSTTHTFVRAVAGATIVLFGMGIPLAFAAMLRRNRGSLHTLRTFSSYAFLYDGYSVGRGQYAFESVVMVRKALTVMIGSLVKDAYLQLLAAAMLLATAFGLLLFNRPYGLMLFNVLDGLSLYTLLLTVLATVVFLKSDAAAAPCLGLPNSALPPGGQGASTCGDLRRALAASDTAVTFLLFAVNVGLVVLFVMLFLRLRSVAALRARARAQLEGKSITTGPAGKGRMALPPALTLAVRFCTRRAEAGLAATADTRASPPSSATDQQATSQLPARSSNPSPSEVTIAAYELQRLDEKTGLNSRTWPLQQIAIFACCCCRLLDRELHRGCESSELLTAGLRSGPVSQPPVATLVDPLRGSRPSFRSFVAPGFRKPVANAPARVPATPVVVEKSSAASGGVLDVGAAPLRAVPGDAAACPLPAATVRIVAAPSMRHAEPEPSSLPHRLAAVRGSLAGVPGDRRSSVPTRPRRTTGAAAAAPERARRGSVAPAPEERP
jgi:hypothetical protein